MQLQSLGKLTRQMLTTSAALAAPPRRPLWATRSITRPQASDHITLVWFSTAP